MTHATIPQKLVDDIESGRVVLVTGTGMSVGATNRYGNPLASTGSLAEVLATEAGFPYSHETLRTVMNAVRPIVGDDRIETLLRDNYTNCRPSKALQDALRFTWKRFYTFNIDDTVANTDINGRRQFIKTFNGLSSRREEWKTFVDLQLIHLRGKSDSIEQGIIFSETEYAEAAAFDRPWYNRLGEDFSEFTVLFVGTSLDEPLFRQHVAKHRPRGGFSGESYMVSPSNLSAIENASLAAEQIRHIRATAQEFFNALLSRFVGGLSPNQVLRATALPSDGTLTVRDLERLRSFAPIKSAAIARYVAEHEVDASRNRKLFFEGFGPNWSVISRGEIAELSAYSAIETAVTDFLERHPIVVIVGESGCGKSTLALWLSLRLAQKNNTPIFQYIPKQTPLLDALSGLANYIKDGDAIVLVDDVYLYASEFADIVAEPRFRRLRILSTVRTSEWNSRIGHVLDDRVKTVEMPRFSPEDIGRLIEKIDRFYPAPQFSRLTYEEKVGRFRRSDKQLLIALKEATFGVGFDEIIENEVGRIEDSATRSVLVAISMSTLPRTGLGYGAAESIFRGGIGRVEYENAIRNLSGIVEIDAQGRLKARHELYARQVIERHVNLDEYERAHFSLVGYFTQFEMPVIRSVSQVDGRLFRFLLNNRNIYDEYWRHEQPDRAVRVYERFEVELQQDGHFWLQYALLLRRLRRQKAALEMLHKSLQAYPQNIFAVHALAHQKLIVATFSKSLGSAEERMIGEAVEALTIMHQKSAADRAVRFDEYPILTLAYAHVNLLVRHGQKAEAKKVAKRYFSMANLSVDSAEINSLKADLMLFITHGTWTQLELRQGALSLEKATRRRSRARKR